MQRQEAWELVQNFQGVTLQEGIDLCREQLTDRDFIHRKLKTLYDALRKELSERPGFDREMHSDEEMLQLISGIFTSLGYPPIPPPPPAPAMASYIEVMQSLHHRLNLLERGY